MDIPPPPDGFTIVPPPPQGFKLGKPSPYETDAQFKARMDQTFGPGKWRDTGDYRTPARENQLRAAGRPTVPPGHTSAHSLGESGAPGAHDIVTPGLSPVVASSRLPPGYTGFPEGDHLHVGEIPKPPPGFTIGESKSAVPPPPPGFTLGAAPITPKATPPKAPPQAPKHLGVADTFFPDVKARFNDETNDMQRNATLADQELASGHPVKGSFHAAMAIMHNIFRYPNAAFGVFDPVSRLGTEGVKAATGGKVNINPRDVTDVASIAAPFVGEMRAASAASKVEKATGFSRAVQDAQAAKLETFRKLTTPTAARRKPAMTTTGEGAKEVSAGQRALMRRSKGVENLRAEQATAKLVAGERAAGKLSPEQNASLIAHLEGESHTMDQVRLDPKGKFARFQKMWDRQSTPLKEAADVMRGVYSRYRNRAEYIIAKNAGAAPDFIEHYYAHIWKQSADEVRAAFKDWPSKQGSGRHFRKREIPTIAEGIARGLTPKYDNPFQTTAAYVTMMQHFLATHGIQSAMKDAGYADWYRPGQQPTGWLPLDGILTERVPRRGGRTSDDGILPPEAEGPRRLGGPNAEPGQRLIGHGTEPEVLLPEKKPEPLRITKQPGTDVDLHLKNVTPKPEESVKGAGDRRPMKEVLYAHPTAAHLYNQDISRGLDQAGKLGDAYRSARQVTNGVRMAQFALSAFHATVMSGEAMISEIARGAETASRGHPIRGAIAIAKAPIAPVGRYLAGEKFKRALLNGVDPEAMTEPLQRAYAHAGQTLRMPDIYRTRGAGSFFQSFARGGIRGVGRDFHAAADRIYGDPKLAGRAKQTWDLVANIVQTMGAPMFEHVIPNLKIGAWSSTMRTWLKDNPTATEKEIDAYGSRLADSIDNRFGEMVQDNLFWNRRLAQLAQLVFLSPSWTYGTIREIGGGIKDIPESAKGLVTGKGITPRTAYVLALATFTGLSNSIYQYMKTGKAPENMQDVMAPRTGGVDPHGQPERAQLPGYAKDVYGYTHDPVGEVVAKTAAPPRMTAELATNKDHFGRPIYRPAGVKPRANEPSRLQSIIDYAAQQTEPFAVQQSSGRKKGTNISTTESFMGIKPAPAWRANPQRTAAMQQKYGSRAWRAKLRQDRKAKAQLLDQP